MPESPTATGKNERGGGYRGETVLIAPPPSRGGEKQDGCALKFASKKLRADRGVVLLLVAVTQDGLALMDASEELRADREVVLAARGGEATWRRT